MQLTTSIEIRWFSETELPETFIQYFKNENPTQTRIDLYLYLPGVEDLGAKLRGGSKGNLEIKQRLTEVKTPFINNIIGRVEKWNKLIFNFTSSNQYKLDEIVKLSNKGWISVSKIRYLLKFEILENREIKRVDLNSFPVNGCNFELTSLEVKHKKWWTLGFEAFGSTDFVAESDLIFTVESVFSNFPIDKESPFGGLLGYENSYGYPTWLNKLDLNV